MGLLSRPVLCPDAHPLRMPRVGALCFASSRGRLFEGTTVVFGFGFGLRVVVGRTMQLETRAKLASSNDAIGVGRGNPELSNLDWRRSPAC